MHKKMMIGICAYNEENNIGNLLRNLIFEQNLPEDCIILVVCSGCTDRTPQIVMEYARLDRRIRLINEQSRRGKACALNKIFKMAKKSAEILILVNADAIPQRGSINKLAHILEVGNAGIVFAQPVPMAQYKSNCSKIVQVIWRLHHLISVYQEPKLSGELCAIRTSCLHNIPENVATDEPFIDFFVRQQGYKISYEAGALVYIRCPRNLSDLFRQRKRIWIGHMQFRSATKYQVPTSSFKNILWVLPKLKVSEIFYAFLGGFFEFFVFIQAKMAFKRGEIPYIWEPIKSTKH